jgi:predicted transcriptional regulator
LLGDVLPQPLVVTQRLRFHAANDLLTLADQLVQLIVAVDVQFPKSLEELGQVADRCIPEL